MDRSTAPAAHAPHPNRGGGRLLALFLIGLFLGAMLCFMAVQILARKSGYVDGLMAVLQHHQTQLRKLARDPACNVDAATPALQRLRTLAEDVAPALAPHGALVQTLNADLVRAVADQPVDCTALQRQVGHIETSCKACHTQLR